RGRQTLHRGVRAHHGAAAVAGPRRSPGAYAPKPRARRLIARRPRLVKATVYVRLKQEVLDPQGDAVKRALATLGFSGVRDVRIGKLIEIELDASAGGPVELKARLEKMADEMLANTVIEDYVVELSS